MKIPHFIFAGKAVAAVHVCTVESKNTEDDLIVMTMSLSNGLVLEEKMTQESCEKFLENLFGGDM